MVHLEKQIKELEAVLEKIENADLPQEVKNNRIRLTEGLQKLKCLRHYKDNLDILKSWVDKAERERGQSCPTCCGRGRVPVG